jgi:hypothetical protein
MQGLTSRDLMVLRRTQAALDKQVEGDSGNGSEAAPAP